MTPRTCPSQLLLSWEGMAASWDWPLVEGGTHSRRNGQSDGWALGSGATAVAGPGPPLGATTGSGPPGRRRTAPSTSCVPIPPHIAGGRAPAMPPTTALTAAPWRSWPAGTTMTRDYKAVPRGGEDWISTPSIPQYEFQFHNPDYSGVPLPSQWVYSHFQTLA